MAASIRLRVLGPVVAEHGSLRPDVTVGRPAHRRLLAILALDAGARVRTDELIDRFWPDGPPATARGAIHTHVSAVRNLLGQDAIVTDGDAYRLDTSVVDVDAVEFVHLAASARGAADRGDWHEALQACDAALALRRGAPFGDLDGEHFAQPTIVRLDESTIELHETRAVALIELDRPADAVVELEGLVLEYPLRERLWECLMVVRCRLGRHTEALRAYQQLAANLAEAGLEPGHDATRLEQRIALRDPMLPTPWSVGRRTVDHVADTAPRKLVERADQLQRLHESAVTAAGGRGHTVLVIAEAGGGKTALLDAFRATLEAGEWHQGLCESLFVPRVMGPMLDIAADLGIAVASPTSDPEPSREELLRALLRHASSDQHRDLPLVVVVEDVHWADEATLDVVRRLARRIGSLPVLLVLTCRDSGADVPAAVEQVVAELIRVRGTRRLDLAPLTAAGCAELSAGTSWNPAALHELTGGNPFFVTEHLAAGTHDTPRSVRDVVRARLTGAPADVRRSVELAALIGTSLSAEIAAAFDEFDAEVERELVRRRVLVDEPDGVRFRHEITRQVVIDDTPARRRRSLHRNILDVLAELTPDDDPRLAFHAHGAGDRVACLHYSRRAAAAARRAGSMNDVVAHVRRAIASLDDGITMTRGELHDELADALGLLDRFDDSMTARGVAIATWSALGDDLHVADSLRRGAWVCYAAGDSERAFADVDRALELLEAFGSTPELASAHAAAARLLGFADDTEAAVPHVRAGLAIAERLGLQPTLAELLNIEACCLAMLGRPWEAVMARSLEVSRSIADAPLTARADYNTFHLRVLESRLADADADFDAALEHADDHCLTTYVDGLRRLRAVSLVQRGLWDDAVEMAGADDAFDRSVPAHVAECGVVLAVVAARRGAPLEAARLDEMLEAAEATAQPQFIVPARIARAEIAWLRGDLDAAWNELRLARDLAPTQVHQIRDIELWAHRIGLGAMGTVVTGPAALEIAGRHDEAVTAWSRHGCPYDAAMALLGAGDEASLRSAVERLERLGAVATAEVTRAKLRTVGA